MTKKATENKRKYDQEYQRRNCKQVKLLLNNEKDADIIRWLDQSGNINGTIKQLIRDKMKGE